MSQSCYDDDHLNYRNENGLFLLKKAGRHNEVTLI